MIGEKNSIWSRLREASPNCIQMRCLCHSLALSIQHAFGKLPSNIGFLLSEIPGWFSNSNQRRDAYVSLFNVMNEAGDAELTRPVDSLPFEKPSATRWLVRGKVLYSILTHWEEFKAYFACTELAQSRADARYKARMIKEMLNDKNNFLHVVFATPIVQEFERVNALFQKNQRRPTHTYNRTCSSPAKSSCSSFSPRWQ
ncbi:Zinc finger protein [Plakobranchus ocellatus]|uniref:Zinc finger protein n=1 Tax=Plakobranchus ocellatus TaxID=259542 RepID=A0AAV3YX21_9GAST|nr:Zinc finger protein [Plakobranchus ocellatus]